MSQKAGLNGDRKQIERIVHGLLQLLDFAQVILALEVSLDERSLHLFLQKIQNLGVDLALCNSLAIRVYECTFSNDLQQQVSVFLRAEERIQH